MRGQHTTHSVSCMRRAVTAIPSELAQTALRRERNHQVRSLVLCVDLVGFRRSGLLTLDSSSIWSDPYGSRRIV
jgi:hypothetical protein